MKNFWQKHKVGIVVTAFICGLSAHIVVGDPISKIVAGFTLDRYMAEKYPEYGFEKHKGYGSKLHCEILREKGPCPAHRKTFLKKILGE